MQWAGHGGHSMSLPQSPTAPMPSAHSLITRKNVCRSNAHVGVYVKRSFSDAVNDRTAITTKFDAYNSIYFHCVKCVITAMQCLRTVESHKLCRNANTKWGKRTAIQWFSNVIRAKAMYVACGWHTFKDSILLVPQWHIVEGLWRIGTFTVAHNHCRIPSGPGIV